MAGNNDSPVVVHQTLETKSASSSICSASTCVNSSSLVGQSSDLDTLSYESRRSGDSDRGESRGNSSVGKLDYTLTLRCLPAKLIKRSKGRVNPRSGTIVMVLQPNPPPRAANKL